MPFRLLERTAEGWAEVRVGEGKQVHVTGIGVLDGRLVALTIAHNVADSRPYLAELTLWDVVAGTPLREVKAALAEHGQYLPFDPILVEQGATLGGTVAANTSGSGRYRYGGVRDFILGGATEGVLAKLRIPTLLSH